MFNNNTIGIVKNANRKNYNFSMNNLAVHFSVPNRVTTIGCKLFSSALLKTGLIILLRYHLKSALFGNQTHFYHPKYQTCVGYLSPHHSSNLQQVSIQFLFFRDYHTLGSRQRRKMYRQIWFFDCRCKRCIDPTENGSYLNGFVCPKCRIGIILSADPLDYNSHW